MIYYKLPGWREVVLVKPIEHASMAISSNRENTAARYMMDNLKRFIFWSPDVLQRDNCRGRLSALGHLTRTQLRMMHQVSDLQSRGAQGRFNDGRICSSARHEP